MAGELTSYDSQVTEPTVACSSSSQGARGKPLIIPVNPCCDEDSHINSGEEPDNDLKKVSLSVRGEREDCSFSDSVRKLWVVSVYVRPLPR